MEDAFAPPLFQHAHLLELLLRQINRYLQVDLVRLEDVYQLAQIPLAQPGHNRVAVVQPGILLDTSSLVK